MNRRAFLGLASGAAFAEAGAQPSAIPIVDAHMHLFDPARPQGVPWPGKNNALLYQPALPDRYRKIAAGLGVTGAIAVECSPWLEDNQWVLDVAARDTIIVGTVGNLDPGKPEFRRNLERFRANPLFRGIRQGNLWGKNLGADLSNPGFIDDLKAVAEAGLVVDAADPNPALAAAVLRLADLIPSLKIVFDHLPQLNPPAQPAARGEYYANLRELGKRPRVCVKVSQVLRRVEGRVPYDLDFYRPRLDEIWEIFGPDRLLYGGDWPNSDQWGSYPQVLSVVREYFTAKGREAAEKYFWRNSAAVYCWVKRDAGQPNPSAE
jgi:predicted TIM-barrel fold metal-dependent hydrolase